MKYGKADIAAQLVMAGWDVRLSPKQWKRVAKRLHKWGFGTDADFYSYECITK